jgi:hypothetical protein
MENFDILITKSDLPFDSRWYIIGDLHKLLELASRERITLPFSRFLNDSVMQELA